MKLITTGLQQLVWVPTGAYRGKRGYYSFKGPGGGVHLYNHVRHCTIHMNGRYLAIMTLIIILKSWKQLVWVSTGAYRGLYWGKGITPLRGLRGTTSFTPLNATVHNEWISNKLQQLFWVVIGWYLAGYCWSLDPWRGVWWGARVRPWLPAGGGHAPGSTPSSTHSDAMFCAIKE